MSERTGSWIMTYTGKKFYLQSPLPDDVDFRDIVHSLSRNCRFTGHTQGFYSVAYHSVLVAEAMKRDGRLPIIQLHGLMHDFSETYLGDIARPLKDLLGSEYVELEDTVMRVIYQKYGLSYPTDDEWQIVKQYDDYLLANEIGSLMANPTEYDIQPSYDIAISSQVPIIAVEEMLTVKFNELLNMVGGAINGQ